jgi:Asp-tRNA(Asn)/Glu-tRNA(Gln) amidotransferase A subunit family amidase
MPFWTSPEPYLDMIKRDPGPLKIALSHQWGDYRATPQIASELERVGRFLEGLGHHVDYALPANGSRAYLEFPEKRSRSEARYRLLPSQ